MAGVMDSVDQRTQLVGQNRLELLLFRLSGQQVYGINVFKVREVLPCPPLNALPGRSHLVRGVAHIRGGTLSIMDMNQAIGRGPLKEDGNSFVIITEYNRTAQGFLVRGVDRIVNMNWSEIHPPPKGTGKDNYLTAVTEVDGKLVEIVDVEKILAEVSPAMENVSEGVVSADLASQALEKPVLVIDDSSIARKQVKRVLDAMGVKTLLKENGKEALDHLKAIVAEGKNPMDEILMIISDIEMPEMDGYTFTAEVRNDPKLSSFHVVLHSSLSGVFNTSMVKKVGANHFLAKFHPDELAKMVNDYVAEITGQDIESAQTE